MDERDPVTHAQNLVVRLAAQEACLPVLIEGVARPDLDKRVGGKWSVTENVAHLARHTELTIERVKRILAQRDPVFPPYRAEEDPAWTVWQSRSLEDSAESLRASRAILLAMVERLTPEQLSRAGRHARLGSLTLRAWIEFYLVHEGHHLYTIFKRARGLE